MSTDLETLDRNDTLDLAKDLMNKKRIRHFPVLEGGRVVGVVSQRDLFHATLGSVMKYGERSERSYLATIAIKEVMSEPPITVVPTASIQEAASVMLESKIGCLPVVEGKKLVGIVSETDILREVAVA